MTIQVRIVKEDTSPAVLGVYTKGKTASKPVLRTKLEKQGDAYVAVVWSEQDLILKEEK